MEYSTYKEGFGARLRELAMKRNMASTTFGLAIGRTSSLIGKYYRGESAPSIELINDIYNAFPDWDFNYLLFGKRGGNIDANIVLSESQPEYGKKEIDYKALYEQALETIKAKNEIIELLKSKTT